MYRPLDDRRQRARKPFWSTALATLALLASVVPDTPRAQPPTPPPAAPSPGRLVRLPDGRRLNFRCSGHGSPTVLLEIGFGGDSLGWSRVQRLVEKTTTVCSYDRAGAGFSDPGPTPRDAAAIARDLDQALRAGKITGPYIVGAHSAGGLYARVFAARRRKDVVGMVLADPTVEHQDQRFAAAFGPGAGGLGSIRDRVEACLAAAQGGTAPPDPARCAASGPPGHASQASTWRMQLSELDTLMSGSSDEVDRTRRLKLTLPVIVLTAERSNADPRAAAFWARLHSEIASAYPNGVARGVESSHMMMIERPDAVAAALEELVQSVRRASAGSPAG